MTIKDKIQNIIKEFKTHGVDVTTINEEYYKLKYLNYYIGDVEIADNYRLGTKYAKASIYIQVHLNDKIKFLKEKLKHCITIKLSYNKSFYIDDDKQYKNCVNDLIILIHHIKIAENKKRKLELDVDFYN